MREHGALPMPAGPEPQPLSVEQLAEIAAELGHVARVAAEATGWRLEDYQAVRGALHSARLLVTEAGRLSARVAELEAEQHVTNEALRARDERIAELEEYPLAWTEKLDAKSLDNFLICLVQATEYEPMSGAVDEIHQLLRSFREHVEANPSVAESADGITRRVVPVQALREAEPDEAPRPYRAQRGAIVIGDYATDPEARTACETVLRQIWPNGEPRWITDGEDLLAPWVAELDVCIDRRVKGTGIAIRLMAGGR